MRKILFTLALLIFGRSSVRVKYILIFFLISFQSLLLSAQEYHVAKNGNDSNNGTLESPFLTISMAAKIALPVP